MVGHRQVVVAGRCSDTVRASVLSQLLFDVIESINSSLSDDISLLCVAVCS